MGNLKRRVAQLLGVLLTVSGLVAIAPPAMAAGGSIVMNGNDITFTGTAEGDSLLTGANYAEPCGTATYCVFFHIQNGAITSITGCQYSNGPNHGTPATMVGCITPGPARVFINLGAGGDTYTSDPLYPGLGSYQSVTVDGGDGNDVLVGGGAPETLSGGAGDDLIYPDHGPALANVGPDTLIGGDGVDVVYYNRSVGAPSGIRLSLNSTADDGSTLPNDIDNVNSDFEGHVLGSGPDVAVGDGRNTTFYGEEGDDRIDGGGGADGIVGGPDNDVIDGGPGVDRIWGDRDRDTPTGGNDTITSTDGESDQVSCGPGSDSVTADSIDKIVDACESITLPGSGTELSAEVQVTKPRLNANKRRKKATLALQCTGGLPCTGTVVVRTTKGKSRRIAGRKKLALGTFTLAANTTQTIKLTLRKPARKILKRTRSADVRARLTLTNERITTFTTLKLTR